MGSGSEACKNIASLILLNNQFSSLPELLKQGRCVINNIQKSASLFLVKNIFSMGLAILALLIIKEYPFKPIQLTLISALSTGIPSFVLTLEPNENRIEGNFLKNVVSKAIPGAFCVILSVLGCFFYRQFIEMTNEQYSTICTILAGCNALFVLKGVCKPFTNISIIFIDKTNQNGEVLLMDASNMGEKVKEGKNQRVVLSDKEVKQIEDIFINHEVVEDRSVSVTYDEIKEKNYSLSAGQYFEVKIEYVDISEEEFSERMNKYKSVLEKKFSDSRRLEDAIMEKLGGFTYE